VKLIPWSKESGPRIRAAYRSLFAGGGSRADAEIVWADMADYCFDRKSTAVETADPNGRIHARHEGRRDVFNRMRFLMRASEIEGGAMIQGAARTLGVVALPEANIDRSKR
jgi:hypothetical protein